MSESIAVGRQLVRRLHVRHATHYKYDRPIQRSVSKICLRPVQDRYQTLADFKLTITPTVNLIEYEDVFGNMAGRFEITQPYSELSVVAESTIEFYGQYDPKGYESLPKKTAFPLAWMPWERKMLEPFLNPVELPETQLRELYDYAMSFVERNDYDLMKTLVNINDTFFKEYAYVPGSTQLATTPFDVMTTKKGVCQDFTNLFICLARLLNIPARYVCGYIFTGNTGASRAQSDASHAWIQLYIPDIGWKGFDPTNGLLPRTDHVRVSHGRYYLDSAPTQGTLYTPAQETMTIDVEVQDWTNGPPQGQMTTV